MGIETKIKIKNIQKIKQNRIKNSKIIGTKLQTKKQQ